VLLHDVEIGEPIGKGAFGKVFAGRLDEVDIALKQMLTIHEGPELDEFLGEAEMLASLRHPNVLTFFGVYIGCVDEDGDGSSSGESSSADNENLYGELGISPGSGGKASSIFIVTELARRGSLDRLVLDEGLSCFSDWQLLKFLRDAAAGMAYLSRKKIIHRE
jgi:serine/threonine protein kinase